MTVYLINIALIIIWGIFLTHISPTEGKKKIYCVIVAVQWILISGLRDWSVGNDTNQYAIRFEEEMNTPWSTVLSNCWNYLFNGLDVKDPGYFLLQKIFQTFTHDYQLWLFFIAIVFTGLMARWIYKYSSMPDVSFIIYSVLFFTFYSLTGHRQTLATALIFFLGYEYAKKRQFVKFAIVAFAAYMLHKSSLVFIVYYLIANISITPIYVIAMGGAAIVVAVLGKQLYGPIATFMGFAESSIDYVGGGAETFATVLLLLCIVAFCFYPWINKQRRDAKSIYNMMFLTLMTTLLVYQNQSFMRIQQYFSLIIMIIIPEIIQAIDKNYRVLAYLFVAVFLIAYFMNQDLEYKFFFMN